MVLNFIISFIIGIIIGTFLFLPIFYYINKLIKKPVLIINISGTQILINGFMDLIFWKITYPIVNKIYNINKLTEQSLTLSGLEKLKLQFEFNEILFKKMPLINSLIYLVITSSIYWTIYLIIFKTLGNTLGYLLGAFVIFILNIISQMYMIKRKKKIFIT
jgi:hypothetical protein